jgi:hypothetical protein
LVPAANEKAGNGNRRRKRSQSAGTQREVAGGGKSLGSGKPAGAPGIAVEGNAGRSGSGKSGRRSADKEGFTVQKPGSEWEFELEDVGMYTGTLIKDLMATVERAERGAQQKRIADEMELRRLFELQAPQMHREPVLVGAA